MVTSSGTVLNFFQGACKFFSGCLQNTQFYLQKTYLSVFFLTYDTFITWVRSRNCGCLVTWFCYQLIAKPGNKTAAVS